MEQSLNALKAGLARLYDNEKFSDLTITCGPYRYNVHQTILLTQTDYFQAAISYEEGQTRIINLKAVGSDPEDDDTSCDNPDAVKHMIYFFYHLDYKVTPLKKDAIVESNNPTTFVIGNDWPYSYNVGQRLNFPAPPAPASATDGNMVMHARVFAAAVKYRVPALQALSASKFDAAVQMNWNHSTFAEAAHIVYSTTPEDVRELRRVVANTITGHEQLLNTAEVKSMVLDFNGLAWELLRMTKGLPAETPDGGTTCCHCGAKVIMSGCDCRRTCIACASEACVYCG